jgi:pimeloyl-ACP methyl ester carboxylesterase
MFATDYINRYPQRVKGAVLIEPGPLDGATAKRIKQDMYDLDIGSEWLNDFAWSSGFLTPDDHARMDYERALGLRDAQPKFGESKTNHEPIWRLGAAASRYIQEDGQTNGVSTYNFTDHLSAYHKPVLFIAGALSQVLGESLQRQQVQKYPDASLAVIDGAGHDVAWIKTAEVLTHIRAYLNAREGAL